MKKFISKILPACVIVVVVFLILLVLLSRSEDIPSYRFLGGRSPVACRDAKTEEVDKCYTYSFEGDFNDVFLKADAELIPAGFVDRTLPGLESHERRYWLKGSFPRGPVHIHIHNNREYREHPISKKGVLDIRAGWIVVEIMYWRNWWWPF